MYPHTDKQKSAILCYLDCHCLSYYDIQDSYLRLTVVTLVLLANLTESRNHLGDGPLGMAGKIVLIRLIVVGRLSLGVCGTILWPGILDCIKQAKEAGQLCSWVPEGP